MDESHGERGALPHDGLAGSVELASDRGHGHASGEPLPDLLPLLLREGGLTTELFAVPFSAVKPRVRALNDQVPLEFRDRRYDAHRHLSGGAREVHSAEREAMNAHAHRGQLFDGLAYVDRVAAEPVKLRYEQHVVRLQLVDQLCEAGPLAGRDAAADAFGYDAVRLHAEACARDLVDLVEWCLFFGADAGIEKRSAHGCAPRGVYGKGVRILRHVQNLSRVIFGHMRAACTKASGFVRNHF